MIIDFFNLDFFDINSLNQSGQFNINYDFVYEFNVIRLEDQAMLSFNYSYQNYKSLNKYKCLYDFINEVVLPELKRYYDKNERNYIGDKYRIFSIFLTLKINNSVLKINLYKNPNINIHSNGECNTEEFEKISEIIKYKIIPFERYSNEGGRSERLEYPSEIGLYNYLNNIIIECELIINTIKINPI